MISTSSKLVSVNILPISELLSEIILERLSLELIDRENFDDPFRISRRSFRLECTIGAFHMSIPGECSLILKERRLRWYGHVKRSNGAVKTAFDIQVNGKRGPGRPKMTWKQLTERDRREWKLSAIDPHDRDTWRSGVRSAMRAASQLLGREPTVVDMAPIPAP